MRRALLPFAVVVLAAHFCAAADPELAKQRDAAIAKGIDWLKKAQASDGSWDYADGPFRNGGNVGHMKQGATALCALALMKSGVAPDDPVINKAFDFITNYQLQYNYEAGCVLMALEARINWAPPVSDEGDTTRDKGAAKKFKPGAKDNDLAKRCVDFLVKNQVDNGGWSYPRGDAGGQMGGRMRMDLSNMQYALLGLEAGERIGITVPKACYEKAQEWLVANQEKEGPEVDAFPVPGADLSYKELKKVEKELHDKLKQIETEFKGKKEGETNAAGHTESDERHTTEEDAARKILRTTEKGGKPHARGWAYTGHANEDDGQGGGTQGGPQGGGGQGGQGGGRRGGGGGGGRGGWTARVTASMTTAGLACLFICKAHLDGLANYEKTLKGPIDKSLRDGAAWLAKNFSVTTNSGEDIGGGNGGGGGGGGRGGKGGRGGGARAGHVDYYLYGLERAGVLLLIPRFGDHDWYDEGCKELVKAQDSNGSWDAGDNGTVGPMGDTCFALLFLSRGTTPIVRIPTRTTTGAAKGN